jgi:hypothetical protein
MVEAWPEVWLCKQPGLSGLACPCLQCEAVKIPNKAIPARQTNPLPSLLKYRKGNNSSWPRALLRISSTLRMPNNLKRADQEYFFLHVSVFKVTEMESSDYY